MPHYEEYRSFDIGRLDARGTLEKIGHEVGAAEKEGWTSLYLRTDEGFCISILGIKPPDQAAIAAAKEKRRKQFERLKKEFEGD